MQTLKTRLETLNEKIEQATRDTKAGKRINATALDTESKNLHHDIKRQSSPQTQAELRPLLLKSITAIERLTEALEQQIKR